MDIKELATSFLELKSRKTEEQRVIDYDLPKQLKELEKFQSNVDERLRLMEFHAKIGKHKVGLESTTKELERITKQLHPLLLELKAHRDDPYTVHVHERTYFDTYIDEEGEIQSRGHYTLTN